MREWPYGRKLEESDVTMSGIHPGDRNWDKSTEDTPDLEIISEDKFHNSDSKGTSNNVKPPKPEGKRWLRSVKQQDNTVEDYAQELKKVKKQLEVSTSRLGSIKKQLKRSDKELAAAQTQLAELQPCRTILAAAQRELSACKDDLFRLQPAPQIPDSDIVNDFESLCQQTIHWIDAQTIAFEKAHPQHEHEHIFSVGSDRDAVIFLAQRPAAGESLARYLVHRFLIDHMFHSDVYLLGLPKDTESLLRSAEESMARHKPPRGMSANIGGTQEINAD